MKKIFFLSLLSTCFAASPMIDFSQDQKIAVQNTILAQVNGKTISMMDVKKKMDMIFHQNFSEYASSTQARLQFYEAQWRSVLMNLIDHELILSDASDKEIKITDGQIREMLEERFGPNVMQTLDRIGLTYDETWKMIKDELIVQQMTGYFIHRLAITSVTPQDIRQAYRLYLKENPGYTEWKYRVISMRTDAPNEKLPEQVYQLLSASHAPPDLSEEALKSLETEGVSISLSSEYSAKTHELSESHKTALSSLSTENYSKPSFQVSRGKSTYRIFYLVDRVDFPAPSFEGVYHQLQNELTQKAIAQGYENYLGKLRKFYGFKTEQAIPDDLHPFSIQ